MEVTLHNLASEIPLAHQALDHFAGSHGLLVGSLAPLHLALEEHLSNIIRHGYGPGQPGTIRVRFSLEASALAAEVEDDARAFNPLDAPAVDPLLPLEEKPLGGLGVHIIRKVLDDVRYRRVNGRNLLVMMKRLATT